MGLFLNQFPKKILRPYGAVEQAPSEETVLKRVKPNSCEWLKRPKVAMSEMAETLTANMDMLATKESPPPFQEWREIVQSETSAIDEKFEYACDDHTKSR